MDDARAPADSLPVARVLPLLAPPHLDRHFDYLVTRALDADAQPGVRVRVRFSGRLVDGYLLERRPDTDHVGELGRLERVVSPERVLTDEVLGLAGAVADRWAGTRADVLRLAVPPRHARAERQALPQGPIPPPVGGTGVGADGWGEYAHGARFLEALDRGAAARAAWQALPGEDWAARLAELAARVARAGRGAVIVVPDQRDLDRLEAACAIVVGEEQVAALAAGLGATERYRRWLRVLRGRAPVVIGTRSAVFAPVPRLGLVAVWDDGDESLAEPRAPYPHAREVALLRAHRAQCAAVIGGFARTTEVQALVEGGWAHDLVGERALVRSRAPHVVAPGDSEAALERDPVARAARIPSVAFAAARGALASGRPVLVQVPRAGYVPALACGSCRTPARCRRCNGPLQLPRGGEAGGAGVAPTCRWCGHVETRHTCGACGSRRLRAVAVGVRRTVEELGPAFPGTVVRHSGGAMILDDIPDGPSLVVSTPGAEPHAPGGYGAALLLDGWALLGRPDLRAAEETMRRWMTAAARVVPGGRVVVVADPGHPVVQALVRWDPVGRARDELADRVEVGFPPASHMVALDGTAAGIRQLLDHARLPEGTEELGPVELPLGARDLPGVAALDEPVERMLLRVPRGAGAALARALGEAAAVRSSRRENAPLRIQVDPLHIG